MRAGSTQAARLKFFCEEENWNHPLRKEGWRGCVLDRDYYDNARISEVLWRALVNAAQVSEVTICGYFETGEICTSVSAAWTHFASYMLNPENYSPEYMIFDASDRWAILADVEVTTLGMDADLADRVDAYLADDGTSLVKLTLESFPGVDIASKQAAYVRGVLGQEEE